MAKENSLEEIGRLWQKGQGRMHPGGRLLNYRHGIPISQHNPGSPRNSILCAGCPDALQPSAILNYSGMLKVMRQHTTLQSLLKSVKCYRGG